MHSSNISELPLILKSTLSISCLKRLNSHNEVINKLNRDGLKSSISIIHPFIIEDLIFIGALHIIDIENYLTEVHVSYPYIPEESSIKEIDIWADNFRIDMEINLFARIPPNPQTSHKQHNLIRT